MKIDVFSHFIPSDYFDQISKLISSTVLDRIKGGPTSLFDLDERLRVMSLFPNYSQILTLAQPPIESISEGKQAAQLAALANDSMAALVQRHPEFFFGFAAAVPMQDPDQSVTELERAVINLGAYGVQIYTNVRGSPLDDPKYEPVFARAADLGCVIWLHPTRGPRFADYLTEDESKFGLFLALGWPYETAVCVARLAFAGVLERYPTLKMILHHAGGLLPHFAQRLGKGVGVSALPDLAKKDSDLNGVVNDQVKRLYADTALNAYLPALKCGHAYFGTDHLLFGTDMPYDDENGAAYIRETIADIDALDVSRTERQQIFEGNIRKLVDVGTAKTGSSQ